MPPPQIKALAKKSGKSPAEVEKAWEKAKKEAKGAKLSDGSTIPDSEEKWSGKHYAYVVGIVKKMLGMKEDIFHVSGSNLPDLAEQLINAYLDEKKLHPSMHKWTIKKGSNKPQKKQEVVGPAGPRGKSLAQKQGARKAARTKNRRQRAMEGVASDVVVFERTAEIGDPVVVAWDGLAGPGRIRKVLRKSFSVALSRAVGPYPAGFTVQVPSADRDPGKWSPENSIYPPTQRYESKGWLYHEYYDRGA
jgi:hypothetical protein